MEKVKCVHCGHDNPERNKYCFNCGYELPKIPRENSEPAIQEPKAGKRKKMLEYIVGIIFFGLSYFAVQQLFFKVPPLDKAMTEMASEINKTCPMMIDQETRLDNVMAYPKNIFQYNYSLINVEKAAVDTAEMRNILEPQIVNTVKTSPQMKFQRDHRTTLNYYYKDKDGLFLLLIAVTPEKYQ